MVALRALGAAIAVLSLALLTCTPHVHSLTVHMVPHTHDDVGWLKTVDQYFIGSNNSFQHAVVTNLITATIAALKRVPERKFVYVEQAFFQRWWRQQNDAMQADVKRLVSGGQLEFINGGWCMHDEAATHYVDMIDQTTLGHQYILQEFGEAANPTIGWQVDPFGHSATQASLLGHEVGFDALFFGRIDYQDHDQRVRTKEMQFSWAPSPSLGPASQVWSEAALDGNYNPPDTFCWDYLCGGDNPQVQDRDDLEDNNVAKRVDDFIRAAYQYARTRKGDIATMNIQFNMGTDFNYESAEQYFINMDKIIAAVNRNGTIHAQYSTPSLYYKAKLAEGITWSTKTDDFFPYGTGPNDYVVGFFTSRPGLKGYVRSSSIVLQTARQLEVFAGGDGTGTEAAWEAIAVAQHHDAVAGTERQHVAYDYTQRIAKGMTTAYRTLDSALSRLAANGTTVVDFRSCPLLNISICPAIQAANDAFTVLIYNPQARARMEQVVLPLYSAINVTVTDSTGRIIPSEVLPVPRTRAHTAASATHSVVFSPASPVPGLGFDTFVVQPARASSTGRLQRLRQSRGVGEGTPVMRSPTAATESIENGFVRLTFDSASGRVQSWTDLATQTQRTLSTEWLWYNASTDRRYGISTLYTEQIVNQTLPAIPVNASNIELTVFKGKQVQMVHQRWSDWVSQTWRLYTDSKYPEVEWTVGPVPFEDGLSREVINRYTSTEIESKGEMWTDANGREFMRRLLNTRLSYNFTIVSPIVANYYPVTTSAYINDSESSLAVLVDRGEGAASLQDGTLELLVHRRLLCQDGCAFENLNETDAARYDDNGNLVERIGPGLIVTGRHTLVMGSPSDVIEAVRLAQQRQYAKLHPVVAATASAPAETWEAPGRAGRVTYLRSELPANVDVMTLQVLFDGSVLLRLAHSFAINEASPLAAPVDVDLSTLFVQPIQSIKQRTLTANADYKAGAKVRPPFKTDVEVSDEEWERVDRMHEGLRDTTITIHPMQILSFQLTF